MTDAVEWNDDFILDLELMKAPQNWQEKTGPFFHLQLPEQNPIGPFHAAELKDFTGGINLPKGTMVRDAKGFGPWISFYEHPFFQRRKPQVLGDNSEENTETFYLLNDGHKEGPFSLSEIKNLFQNKEIILTDLISNDGQNWQKLYEMESFDRREHGPATLPESPGWEIFKESNKEIQHELANPQENLLETHAMANLAFLENVKSGKAPVTEVEEEIAQEEAQVLEFKKEESDESEDNSSKTFQYATYAMICFFLFGSVFFFFEKNDKKVKLAGKNTQQSKDAPMLKPAKKSARSTNYRAPRLRARVKPRSRRPASITSSNSFDSGSKRKMRDSAYDDSYAANEDNYYDDPQTDSYDYDNGDTPVEQDPIRKKLDKKIIDSEEDYYQDDQNDNYDDPATSQYDANGDAPEIEPSEVWGNPRSPAGEEYPEEEDALDNLQDELGEEEEIY